MGRADYFEPGDWNAVCSMCGKKRKASQLVKNWQGMYRCPEHNEPRHPQDFVRGEVEHQSPPWTQPQTFAYTAGEFLLTEDSNTLLGPLNYITTEDNTPITTET
jgi:hypothetical protein